MMNAASFLDSAARAWPDRVMLTDRSGSWSYSAVHSDACRVAGGLLAHGVKAGEAVAISCPNIVEFVSAYFGVLKLGAVPVPLNLMLLERDVQTILEQTNAVAYICWAGAPGVPVGREGHKAYRASESCKHFFLVGDSSLIDEEVHPPSWQDLLDFGTDTFTTVPRAPDDTAEIIYSSGTSGRARGAINTHAGVVLNAYSIADCLGLRCDDKALIVVPLFAGYSRGALLLPGMLVGAELVLLPRYDKLEVWRTIRDEKITAFAGVPAMYFDLLEVVTAGGEQAVDVASHWRLAISAGAPLPLPLQSRFEQVFEVPIRQMLGMAEARIIACERADEAPRRGSVGRPVWGTEIMVADENLRFLPVGEKGEILVNSPANMTGYQSDPLATDRVISGSWVRTGDVGYLEPDGFLHIVDRKMDVINSGGYKIYPREVEDVISQHPSVALVSVVGQPTERLGEEAIAFVTLHKERPCTVESLKSWAESCLPSYTRPRHYEICEDLPKGPTGKILKQELRRMASESADLARQSAGLGG